MPSLKDVLPAFLRRATVRIKDPATRRALLDIYIEDFSESVAGLHSRLQNGSLSIAQWELAMREEIRMLHRGALVLSYGGEWSAIPQSEWGRLGGHLRVQYQYLHNYAVQIQQNALGALSGMNKPWSEKYLLNRSRMYGGAARASFYRGMAMGLLPQVPGDGQTQCLTNCQCELRFEEGDQPGLLLVYWELRPAEHCDDCVLMSQQWNPYELWLPVGLSAQEWVTWCPKLEV